MSNSAPTIRGRSGLQPESYSVLRVVCFAAIAACLAQGPAHGETCDWRRLETSDTLTLYVKGVAAGRLVHSLECRNACKQIHVATAMNIHASQSGGRRIGGVSLGENRVYNRAGRLISARQHLKSATGTTVWDLGSTKDRWHLSVTAGGQNTTRTIASIADNLNATCRIRTGILDKKLRVGSTWHDTVFDLTSAAQRVLTITCTERPSNINGRRWAFEEFDNLIRRSSRIEFSRNGRLVFQELEGMMEARAGRPSGADTSRVSAVDFSELSSIGMPPRPHDSVGVCVTFSEGEPDSSVQRYYARSGEVWRLDPARRTRRGLPLDSLRRYVKKRKELARHLQATVTIQSAHPDIRKIADSCISSGAVDSREAVARVNRWVYATIAKKGTITFSSALETLRSGQGDCGEHAVLLAAVLRAAGIPARVTLGLVYLSGRGGWYYHAWVAAFVGAWIFADPALGVCPADFGRIPLVIDDTGEKAILLARTIDRISIAWCE